MLAVCRITTIVAMLLHSIFGCSLHHAAACDSHHHGCHSRVSAEHLSSGAAEHDCCSADGIAHGECCGGADEGEISQGELTLSPFCPGCPSGPCDGQSPGCHSIGKCSFVPSSPVVFACDVAVVGFLTVDLDPHVACSRMLAWRSDQRQRFPGVVDPLTRCASLCVWRI